MWARLVCPLLTEAIECIAPTLLLYKGALGILPTTCCYSAIDSYIARLRISVARIGPCPASTPALQLGRYYCRASTSSLLHALAALPGDALALHHGGRDPNALDNAKQLVDSAPSVDYTAHSHARCYALVGPCKASVRSEHSFQSGTSLV